MNHREWFLKANSKRPNRAFIWNENYMQGCYVMWPVTTEQLKAEYLHINKGSKVQNFDIFTARFLFGDEYSVMAFSQKKPSCGVIAHEALHLANYTLDYLGVRFDPDNDEPYAYFLTWAVNKIYNLTREIK